jgi:hypothetical protein
MMGLNEIIFGASVTVMCVGAWDVVRTANAGSLRALFERLGEGLIGRLCAWWLLAVFLLMLLTVTPS